MPHFYVDYVTSVTMQEDWPEKGLKVGDIREGSWWLISYDIDGEGYCVGPEFVRKQDAEAALAAVTKAGFCVKEVHNSPYPSKLYNDFVRTAYEALAW